MISRDQKYREKARKQYENAIKQLETTGEEYNQECNLEYKDRAARALNIALALISELDQTSLTDEDQRLAGKCYYTKTTRIECTKEDYKNAISAVKNIRTKSPQDYQTLARYYEAFGTNYYCEDNEAASRRKQYNKAIATLKKLSDHHKADDSVYRELALLYKKTANYPAAIEAYAQMQSRLIDDYVSISNCYILIGDFFKKEKDFTNALPAYSSAITTLTSLDETNYKVISSLQEACRLKLGCMNEYKSCQTKKNKTKTDPLSDKTCSEKPLNDSASSSSSDSSTEGLKLNSLFAQAQICQQPNNTMTLSPSPVRS